MSSEPQTEKTAEEHFKDGLAFSKLGDDRRTFESYKKAIDLRSGYLDAYINLGNAYFRKSDFTSAIDSYEKALKIDPNRKETCGGYGDLLLKFNQHAKALLYIKKGAGFISFTQKDFKII